MLEQVELKIQELKKLRAEEYYKKKDEDLKAWGLTTKIDGKKVTPIIVTDEEYEELVKASNGVGKAGRNAVANLLNALSIVIMIIGAVAGVIAADLNDGSSILSFTIAMIIAGVIAVLFRGISEAIRLLQQLIDGRTLERPDPAAMKKPQVKKAPQKQPGQAPMFVGYPTQGQAPAYPYPVYAAQGNLPPQAPQMPTYSPEHIHAYYQQPAQAPEANNPEA